MLIGSIRHTLLMPNQKKLQRDYLVRKKCGEKCSALKIKLFSIKVVAKEFEEFIHTKEKAEYRPQGDSV